jgi:tRNA uridine 5-carboxymethylaminomethyl modification enzyme
LLEELGTSPLSQNAKLFNLLSRPQVGFDELKKADAPLAELLSAYDKETIEQAEIKIKYESYFICHGCMKRFVDLLKVVYL